jgi:hypothetical protein
MAALPPEATCYKMRAYASPSVAIKANDLPVDLHGLPAMISSDGGIGTVHVNVEQA